MQKTKQLLITFIFFTPFMVCNSAQGMKRANSYINSNLLQAVEVAEQQADLFQAVEAVEQREAFLQAQAVKAVEQREVFLQVQAVEKAAQKERQRRNHEARCILAYQMNMNHMRIKQRAAARSLVQKRTIKPRRRAYDPNKAKIITVKRAKAANVNAIPKEQKSNRYSCDKSKCSYSTSHQIRIKTHYEAHVIMEEDPTAVMYHCDPCDFLTPTNRVFQGHAIAHQKEKNCLCSFAGCTSRFKSDHGLKRHIKAKHPLCINGV